MAPATRTANNNQFIVQRHLGQALYGDVWLCEDERHDHTLVAIKQVSLQCAKRALTHNRHLDNPFEERRVAAYLTHVRPQGHTNILQFRQEFLEKGAWYMVTEYCEGGDLMRRLEVAPQNRLQESVALHYFRQIANGVRFLHDNGVAHRDLSLENVLLKNGVCKICDFGLAVIVGSTQTNNNNNNNNPAVTNNNINTSNQLVCSERVGKAYYMAPEVVAEEAYDPMAADVWSLGIMLFIMLTGSPLVSSACRDEKAFLALEAFGVEKILEVWGLRSSVSSGVCGLLSRMLQVRPEKRPTIQEVLAHRALQGL